jgi:hypothetical protein
MHMIGHQNTGMNTTPLRIRRAPEHIEIVKVIHLGIEDGLTIIPTLNYVQWLTGDYYPW